jgi:predicted nucleotidyltransferase
MKDIDSILPALRRWASQSEQTERLWVYGSRVPGGRRDPQDDSDLDVAIDVVNSPQNNHYAWFRFRHKDWEQELNDILPFRVHLTHYNPCVSPDLPVEDGNVKKEVDRYGILVYERAKQDTSMPTDTSQTPQ